MKKRKEKDLVLREAGPRVSRHRKKMKKRNQKIEPQAKSTLKPLNTMRLKN
jgi:hypothetical protein